MKRIIAMVVCALLIGCAAQQEPRVEYRVERVPEPPVITEPALDKSATSPDERARALAIYISELRTALREAINALEVYRVK